MSTGVDSSSDNNSFSDEDYLPSDRSDDSSTFEDSDSQNELEDLAEASIPTISPLRSPTSPQCDSPPTSHLNESVTPGGGEGASNTTTPRTYSWSLCDSPLSSSPPPPPPQPPPGENYEQRTSSSTSPPGERPSAQGETCETSAARQHPSVGHKRRRNTVYCYFCEEPVLQFARHLERQHSGELEVQRLQSLRKGSLKRKQILSVIRNKGNYLESRMTQVPRPVRRPALKRECSKPLPCNRCYGFFARKQLWRHVKRCPVRRLGDQQEGPDTRHTQNLAQNMTLATLEGNAYLREHVYPRMRADDITAAVKSDPLICAYGGRLSKTHQDKHQVNFISRKMRELGKLVIALKKCDPSIKSLLDALKPEKYDIIVRCTKEVSGYSVATNRFASPTYAMNIQTSIKDCCQLACNYLYQHVRFETRQQYEDAEFPFKQVMSAISSNWKFDVSHQAANNLETASMNKITMVPLAKDLNRFKTYLVNLANESVGALQYDERNQHAFKNLLESVYCRVMLLCRKRCGELSRLTVEMYVKSGERHSYEEFVEAIRPSEMVLVRKFKRVVIQGKRKTTPVIFSADAQRHIDILLRLRSHFVPSSNPFLFASVNSENPIHGYKVIQKHARNADLVHPEAVTTRALRKHLATVCQVLSMSNEDIEQIACFMGHSPGVHRKEYRLPDDIFQTAKVSKLLLMMESGHAGRYKGKTLDDIDIDLDTDIIEELRTDRTSVQEENEDDPEEEEEEEGHCIGNEERERSRLGGLQEGLLNNGNRSRRQITEASTSATSSCQRTERNGGSLPHMPLGSPTSSASSFPLRLTQTKKKVVREPWPPEEKHLVLNHFAEHIRLKKPPRKKECLELLAKHPDKFKNRTWQKIKVFVHNSYYTCNNSSS